MVAKTNKGKSHAGRKHHVQSRKNSKRKMHSKKTHMRNHKHKTSRAVKLRLQRGGFNQGVDRQNINGYILGLQGQMNLFDLKLMLIYAWKKKVLTKDEESALMYILNLSERNRMELNTDTDTDNYNYKEYVINLDLARKILGLGKTRQINLIPIEYSLNKNSANPTNWFAFTRITENNRKTPNNTYSLPYNLIRDGNLDDAIIKCFNPDGELKHDSKFKTYKFKEPWLTHEPEQKLDLKNSLGQSHESNDISSEPTHGSINSVMHAMDSKQKAFIAEHRQSKPAEKSSTGQERLSTTLSRQESQELQEPPQLPPPRRRDTVTSATHNNNPMNESNPFFGDIQSQQHHRGSNPAETSRGRRRLSTARSRPLPPPLPKEEEEDMPLPSTPVRRRGPIVAPEQIHGVLANASKRNSGGRSSSRKLPNVPGSRGSRGISFKNVSGALPDEPQRLLPLTHYWFTKWPDHGVPAVLTNYCEFIKEIYNDIMKNGGRTLIHCSAGVGRTGVVYVTLYLLFKYDINPNHDFPGNYTELINEYEVYDTIKKARESRMELVQTNEQFHFILRCFGIKDIQESYYTEDLLQYNIKGNNSKPYFGETLRGQLYDTTYAENREKNRYGNILPFNKTRVKINVEDDDYINASFAPYPKNVKRLPNISDLSLKQGFILGQCPNAYGLQDFRDMVRQYEVRRIVMVTGLIEGGKTKCNDYLNFSQSDERTGDDNFTKIGTEKPHYGYKTLYEYEPYPGSRPDSPNASRA
jgi:protein tyrosine phosphatase